jgi:hypothetical protein
LHIFLAVVAGSSAMEEGERELVGDLEKEKGEQERFGVGSTYIRLNLTTRNGNFLNKF